MDDTSDIIALLCTRVGMIMEDASVVALTVDPLRGKARTAALVRLEKRADEIVWLIAAARAMDG